MEAAARAREAGPRDRQREETRERLFQAAIDELRRTGVVAGQVDRIVTAARVSRGSFYFHFPTKEAVLNEWERRRELEITARLARPRAGSALSLREALLQAVTFLADLAASPDGKLLLDTLAIHVREGSDPDAYPLLAEIERRLAEALAHGEMRGDIDARQAAILFLSNVFGFLVARTRSRQHPKPALLVDVFLTGVTARAGLPVARATTAATRRRTKPAPKRAKNKTRTTARSKGTRSAAKRGRE